MTKKEQNRQRVLNGGRGGGEVYRRLVEYYENKVANLKKENEELRSQLNSYTKYKEHIIKLEAQIEKMECCENCIRYKPCITCNETVGNNCDYYSGGNVCNNWQLN